MPSAPALERVAADPALRRRLIEAGLATVHDRYTWARGVPRYWDALGSAGSPLSVDTAADSHKQPSPDDYHRLH